MAAVAPLAGAALSYYEARKARKQQQPYINAITGAAQAQTDQAKQLAPYATDFYKRAGEAFDPAAAYYKAAFAGGAPLLAATAPDTALVGQKYGNIIGTAQSLNPRTGGGANLYDKAFRAGDDTQSIVNAARSGAGGKLVGLADAAGGIAGSAAGAGSRAAGTGITGLDAGLSSTRNLDQTMADAISQFNMTQDQWRALGRWANGKRGGGGSPTNSITGAGSTGMPGE